MPSPTTFNDLSRVAAEIHEDIGSAIERVISGGRFILGPEVAAFEREFASYHGVSACAAVGNGTDALEIALRAVGVRAGDSVATVANAGGYSTVAVRALGALPLYVDVDMDTLTMSAPALSKAMIPEIKAVVVTHLYGLMANMEDIVRVAAAWGIAVVEDCAQAHGAEIAGRKAGSWGHAGCFSFYPTKNLGALGDGGAIISRDSHVVQKAKLLRQYGWSRKYVVSVPGGRNSRLDELQAAVLRAKLPHLDAWNARRRTIANQYGSCITHPEIMAPSGLGKEHSAHLYVVRTKQRDKLAGHLRRFSIPYDIHYPVPDHLQPQWKDAAGCIALPISESACREVLSIPCFPGLLHAEVQEVCDVLNAWDPADGE